MTFPEWMGRFPRDSAQWQLSEDKHLVEQFRCGSSLENLVSTHGRPSHAIESRLFKLIETNYAIKDKEAQDKLKGTGHKPFDLAEALAGKPIEAWMKGHWVKCDFWEQRGYVIVQLKGYKYNIHPSNVRMASRKVYILTNFDVVHTFKVKADMETYITVQLRGDMRGYRTVEADID